MLVGRGGRYKVVKVSEVWESKMLQAVLPKSMDKKITVVDLEYMGGEE